MQTAEWVWHDPTNSVTSLSPNPATQMNPTNPTPSQSVDLWIKVGYQFQINTCYVYYTTDGSNPEGAYGVGKGTTQTVQGIWVNHDSVQENIDWWKCTIPGQPTNTTVRYKLALFNAGIGPISDGEISGSKLFGETEASITNFNPANAVVWQHNDLNPSNMFVGLQSGFHILRARAFLPRAGQSSVYNTFSQTFYYDGPLPTGVIAYPANNTPINTSSYTVVVRTDSTVTGVNFNIQDSNPANDDIQTGLTNGNGNNASGQPIFVPATPIASPDPTLGLEYPNYPEEWRFTYANVPSSGPATINVQLNEYGTAIYTNHYTILVSTNTTVGPAQTLEISAPPTNGMILTMNSNTTYLVRACFTPSLDTNANASLFNLAINGVLQPQSSYIFLRRVPVPVAPDLVRYTTIGAGARQARNLAPTSLKSRIAIPARASH